MINIIDESKCCGCQACGDACPKGAISFVTDEEGFWYPAVDSAKCINCGLCEKVCPQLHAEELKKNDFAEPKCVAAVHKNLSVRFDSTSGGAFTALAEKMFADGGYVGGAVYTDAWGVRWLVTDSLEELPRLRSSKYLQSDSQGMYKRVGELLHAGKKVLVCGLPCQIAALKSYLGGGYDNLILVDLICRYINSPLAYRKYLDCLEREHNGKIVYVKAKNKELGWRNLTHKCVFDNGRTYYGTFAKDIFMKASMRLNCLSRPSCYECQFKGFPRCGDITIGDYWTNRGTCSLDDDTGTSVILLNSQKGVDYFNATCKKLKIEDAPFDRVIKGNPALLQSLTKSSVNRIEFFERIKQEDFRAVVNSMSAALPKRRTGLLSKVRGLLSKFRHGLGRVRFALQMAQYRPSVVAQFVYLNFLHPGVRSDFRKGNLIYPTPYCVFDIDKSASIVLNGPLEVGTSPFKSSRVETRIKMQRGAKMVIGSSYAFGYGSDIEIFPNAYFESKGGLPTNSFTTIICQNKIVIGKNVACGRNVTIRDNNGGHLVAVNGYRDSMPILIGDHVWLTQSVTILSGVKIGDGTIISACSLVKSSLPSFCVASGSPAQVTQRDVYWKM